MADGIDMHFEGEREFALAIDKLIAKANSGAAEFVAKGGLVIEAKAKANFEGSHPRGKPHEGGSKPNVVSGNLRRSIHVDRVASLGGGKWMSEIGPSENYARRVELGFSGTDSLGRHYDTKGYPYMKPGLDSAMGELEHLADRTFRAALGV